MHALALSYCILLHSFSTSASPLLLGSRIFHTPYPGSTFKSPRECDGSDLVLCRVDCGLRATSVFCMFCDSALQLISSGRCTIIFIIAYGPLSCYVIGL